MSGWGIFWLIVVIAIVAAVVFSIVANLSDIKRYLRIRSM
jgi:ABC-type multidrug transport system permease subunit